MEQPGRSSRGTPSTLSSSGRHLRMSVFGYDDMQLSFILVILTACTDSLHGSNTLIIGSTCLRSQSQDSPAVFRNSISNR